MNTSYENIYSRFLGKITDYKFANLSQSDAYENMHDWLHSIYAESNVRMLFSSFSLDDDIMEMNFEMLHPIDEEYDVEFVEEVFARGMVIHWLEPQVKTTATIAQAFTGKDAKFYSQNNHTSGLESMLKTLRNQFKRFVRNHKYADFAINGANK